MLIMSGAAGTVSAQRAWLCSRSSPPLRLKITVISYMREPFQVKISYLKLWTVTFLLTLSLYFKGSVIID